MEPRLEGETPQDIPLTSGLAAASRAGGRAGSRAGGRSGGRASGAADYDAGFAAGTPQPGGPLSAQLLSRVSAFYLAAEALMLVLGVLVLSALAGWYVSQLAAEMLTLRFVAALVVAELMLLLGAGLAARLLWQRSGVVLALRKGERLASRVMVVLLRSSGEVGALLLLFGALALGLPVIIAPDSLLQLSALGAEASEWLAGYPLLVQWVGFVLLGIAIIAAGASLAAMVLMIFGFFAERLALMLQLADDTRRVREQLEAVNGSEEALRAFR